MGGGGTVESPYRNDHHREDYAYNLERTDSYGDGSYISSGSTVGSGGVDFSTGLSGHTGISRGKRRGTAPRKQVRMMSQHDGIAHIRRQQMKHGGGASVVSMGNCSKASVVTL